MSLVQENIGLIKSLSSKVWSRLKLFPTKMEYSDLEQEAYQMFIVAEKEWSADKGAKLSTYATRIILRRLNFITETEIQKVRHEHISIEENETSYEYCTESFVDEERLLAETLAKLTPVAKVLFKETFYPSNMMVKEFRAKERQKELKNSRRSKYFYMNTVSEFLIKSGVCATKVESAKQEILTLGKMNHA